MRYKTFGVLALLISLLGACSTMNNEFSCNLTAGDKCLSMDEVNAMTEDKDRAINQPSRARHASGQRIWLAPWTDSDGQSHAGGYAYLDAQKDQA